MAEEGYGASYLLGKRRIEDNYNLSKQSNDYAQALASQQAKRGLDRMAYQYGKQREAMPWGYGSRGLNQRTSGQYAKAFGDYQTNRSADFGDSLLSNAARQQELMSQYQSIWNNRVHDLDQNEVSEADRRAALAAQLRGL